MIRWTFHFLEGAVATELKEDEEGFRLDGELTTSIFTEKNRWITLPGNDFSTMVNLDMVRAIIRQVNISPDTQETATPTPSPSQEIA